MSSLILILTNLLFSISLSPFLSISIYFCLPLYLVVFVPLVYIRTSTPTRESTRPNVSSTIHKTTCNILSHLFSCLPRTSSSSQQPRIRLALFLAFSLLRHTHFPSSLHDPCMGYFTLETLRKIFISHFISAPRLFKNIPTEKFSGKNSFSSFCSKENGRAEIAFFLQEKRLLVGRPGLLCIFQLIFLLW